ncbi:MAG: response regulator transcription factor [Gemmatimonadaceae bacterium]|nr:response regulator transcription factor [Gemmatimonadaceae bacterium]
MTKPEGDGPTFRVLVADDEPLARARLLMLLKRHPAFEVVQQCSSGIAVLEAVERDPPDVMFLDVRMPRLDGVSVVAAMTKSGVTSLPAIVFVTALDEYAPRAFDMDAVDYLVKPVDIDRFDRAMERVSRHMRQRLAPLGTNTSVQRFAARDAKGVYFVPCAEIERIEAEGNYVALVTRVRRHLVRDTMKGISSRLDPAEFVRVHRSAIVRIACIRRLTPCGHGEYHIALSDGSRLTSGRSYSRGLRHLVFRKQCEATGS